MNHMTALNETSISRAILRSYARDLDEHLSSDVLIVGAGPSGLTAAWHLAARGLRVVILEKRLSPGGGVWGGAIGMNKVVVQEEAIPILKAAEIRTASVANSLYVVDASDLACSLCLKALRSGAALFNLFTAEDVCVHENAVSGVVANRTMISGAMPIDPLVFRSRAVIDATGHDAAVVQHLRRRGLLRHPGVAELAEAETFGEAPMHAAAGERFVVDRVAEVFPGLWVCGMAVCACFVGPRMGPIFGGMLLSGQRAADQVLRRLGSTDQPSQLTGPGRSRGSRGGPDADRSSQSTPTVDQLTFPVEESTCH
jgi:thiamine thiazole synthase